VGDLVIEAHGLRKKFKEHVALAGLDLEVPAGSIYGFLGRNGAGKTTTIKLLMGFLKVDGGEARVLGMPAGDRSAGIEIRRRIGLITEEKDLYSYMTVSQIIRFTRSFFPKWRDDLERRYLALFDLPPNRKIADLSKGMRSKLMLLLGISHGAELLILRRYATAVEKAASDKDRRLTRNELLRELLEAYFQ
jgi:ABC-2 type transport system ATP-binding protein